MPKSEKITARDKMEKVYFELLETTHYNKITVSDIIERAGVSRTTFYRHYVDIFDMHEKVADRLSNSIIEMSIKSILADDKDAYDKIAKIFTSQDKYINLLSGKNGSRYFFESIYYNAMGNLIPSFANLPEEIVFRLKFITIATIGVYVKNILEGREHDMRFIDVCKSIVNLDKILGGNYGE